MQAGGPQGVTVEDSMSMVHLSAGMNAPASEHLISEPMLVARMAAATLKHSRTPWLALAGNYAAIRDKIEAVLPDFAGFNEKIKQPGGFRLRNTASERVWTTPTGKATFSTHAMPTDLAVERIAERNRDVRVFTLTTLRSHDQYNTTIYGHDDRYRGVFGHRRVVFINATDLKDLGLKGGDWVDITSLYVNEGGGDVQQRHASRFLLVEYDIPRGCLASYYPETNPLVPLESFSLTARTPTSKSIPVVLTKHTADNGTAASARELARDDAASRAAAHAA
jgi:anaerobic selenocysteine-containing dehydrogenase